MTTCTVERPGEIGFEPTLRLGPRLARQRQALWFVLPTQTATVDYCSLHDVVVDGHTGVIFKDAVKIKPSWYSVPNPNFVPLRPDTVVELDDDRIIIVGYHTWHNNYFHWLLQCIPALELGRTVNHASPIAFLLPPLTSWQRRLMEVFGLGDVAMIHVDRGKQYKVRQLHCNSISQASTVHYLSNTVKIIIDAKRDMTPNGFAGPLVYVSRADAKARRMRNEAALCRRLQAEGVAIVCPGELSVDEQIATFAAAAAVIGPHGAGLANIAFCRPQTIVYELMSSRRLNACYAITAQSFGLEYWGECFVPPADCDARADEWEVSIDEVVATVRAIRRRIARHRG